jgi:hypothetical protein
MEMNIDIEDFNIIKILISERYYELKNRDSYEIDLEKFEIIKNMYYKYCKENGNERM